MKIIIKRKIDENLFAFEINVIASNAENELFFVLGEPFIDISFGDNPKKLKKIYSDSPFIITNESQVNLLLHKNEIVEKIKNSVSDLKLRFRAITLEDEIIEF